MRTLIANKQVQHNNVKINKMLKNYQDMVKLNFIEEEESIDPRLAIWNNEQRVAIIIEKA